MLWSKRNHSQRKSYSRLSLCFISWRPPCVLPAAVSTLAESSIAVRRLKDFLIADELQPNTVVREAAAEVGQESVIVRDATFKWNRHENRIALEEVNFSARSGQLCCLVGRVGAGKSSFIQAVLGDLQYLTRQAWRVCQRRPDPFGFHQHRLFCNC